MTESTFRSKYAGMPGSLVAIRVDYARRGTAFDPPPGDGKMAADKRDIVRWKFGHRLGDHPEWNTSAQTTDSRGQYPKRQLMHQLSEYQAVKLDYNFRSSALPSVNKTTQFVPKASKLQIDRSLFLTEKEKGRLVATCPGTSAHLSRAEMNNRSGAPIAGVDREHGWNPSVEMTQERTNIYALRQYDDYREINRMKTTILDGSTYVPPQVRHTEVVKAAREKKLTTRTKAASASAPFGGAGQQQFSPFATTASDGAAAAAPQKVFKMSNINEWWDDDYAGKAAPSAAGAGEGALPPIERRASAAQE
jgi:hypothetical protein